MKQYFNIQLKQGKRLLYFFDQCGMMDNGHHIVDLQQIIDTDVDTFGAGWDYVRMAGDIPVFKKKDAVE